MFDQRRARELQSCSDAVLKTPAMKNRGFFTLLQCPYGVFLYAGRGTMSGEKSSHHYG